MTEIETWRRDPYAIYARRILRLEALDPLDAEIGAAERGTVIHQALDEFVRRHPGPLPEDALAQLTAIGQHCFGPLLSRPSLWAFWWPRFLRIAEWFIAHDAPRRADLHASHAEVRGRWEVTTPSGLFTLSAKADRIDQRRDGAWEIIDYKTGGVPQKKEIERGLSPQLPLEAAMLSAGAFEGLPAGHVAALAYWRLSGGEVAGTNLEIKGDVAKLTQDAADGLRDLIDAFAQPASRYLSLPDADAAPRFSDYGHLARIREWSVAESEET